MTNPTRETRPLSAVPGHINPTTEHFCSREGQLAPGGRCPDGCDHADHYSNDGHPECEDVPVIHGYGDTTDCLCGRNFPKVRGLREHITKARS